MTDWLLVQIADWGAVVLAVVTFLSCLALPVPSSILMLGAGAFAASGDLALAPVAGAALGGAVLGDQAGYGLGRVGYARAVGWVPRRRARASAVVRARVSVRRNGRLTVFLSRWLFSALGPSVNLLASAGGIGWLTFTLAAIAGEVIWVALYVGLGYLAAGQLEQASAMLGNVLGLLASMVVTLGLGALIWRHRPRRR